MKVLEFKGFVYYYKACQNGNFSHSTYKNDTICIDKLIQELL